MDPFAPIQALADLLTFRVFGITEGSHLGDAVSFFLYDVPKILILLTVIVFAIAMVRTFFSTEKTRRLLAGKRLFGGNVVAALLGVVTPFCSCSAVPLFIGFVEAGIPLGVTFSFLVASPMVNEVALVMLFGSFGWKVAAIYLVSGLVVAIVSGIVIGMLGLERYVEEYVYGIKVGEAAAEALTWRDRAVYSRDFTVDLVKKLWPYIVVAIAVGGLIHGYVPESFIAKYAGPDNPLGVPLAVALGVPMYSNAAGTVPVMQSLVAKGLPLGTALAFMMAITALSLPEGIILRRVLKPKLIAVFFGINAMAIIAVGYLFNMVMPYL